MKAFLLSLCLFCALNGKGQTIQETWNQCFYWADCFYLSQKDSPCWIETKTSEDGKLLLRFDDTSFWFIAQAVNSKTARAKIMETEVEFTVSDEIYKGLNASIINKTRRLALVPSDCYDEYLRKQKEEYSKQKNTEQYEETANTEDNPPAINDYIEPFTYEYDGADRYTMEGVDRRKPPVMRIAYSDKDGFQNMLIESDGRKYYLLYEPDFGFWVFDENEKPRKVQPHELRPYITRSGNGCITHYPNVMNSWMRFCYRG